LTESDYRDNLAGKFMKPAAEFIRQYLAAIGSEGGKARAEKYDKATLRKWAKKGGRPPKKGKKK
jgi:hypothetical protein